MDKVSVNPFVHRHQFTKLDYVKIIFGSVFLFPVRLFLILLLFTINSMLAKLILYILKKRNLDEKEENKWRLLFLKPTIYLWRATFFVAGFYNLKVTDKSGAIDNNKTKIFVLAPHTSFFDVATNHLLGVPTPIASYDTVDIPLIGNLIKLSNPILMVPTFSSYDTFDVPLIGSLIKSNPKHFPASSRRNVLNKIAAKLKHNSVMILPEGYCGNNKVLAQFKPGVFKLGLPVHPVVIKYSFIGPDTITRTRDGPTMIKQVWLTLCRWSTGFEIIKLPAYYPNEQEKQDPELFAENVRRLMAKEIDIRTSLYSTDDLFYFFDDLQTDIVPEMLSKFVSNIPRSPACLKFLVLCLKIVQNVPIEKITELNGHVVASLNKAEGRKNKVYKRQVNENDKAKFSNGISFN